MATETTRQIVQENPEIEAYRLGLLGSVSQFINRNLGGMPPSPITPPAYRVAGLTPLQQEAAVMARRGIGGYQPYMQAGLDTLRRGEAYTEQYGYGGLQEALGATREGQKVLSQAAQIAAQQRAQPYAYQEAATRALNRTTGLGYDAMTTGQTDLGRASDMSREAAKFGYGALAGTGRQYDPAQVGLYMNPYEDAVVQQAMRDIDRGSQQQRQQLGAQAAATGAFGGSRQAVAEQEMNRNLAEQKARTASQLRMAGYGQASQQAQQAFETAQQRRQQAAQLYGNIGQQAAGTALSAAQAGGQLGMSAAQLGQAAARDIGNLGIQYGQLGQADVNQLINLGQASSQMGQGLGSLAQTGGQLGAQLGQMGIQQAGLGQMQQALNLGDVKTIEALGARDQALQQSILDAQRQSNLQLYQLPYQQYSFLSDIYKGTPSSQQITQMSQTQDPSTFQQIAGLGIAGLSAAGGAKAMGMF